MTGSYIPTLPHRVVALLDAGDLSLASTLTRPVATGDPYAWKRLNFELATLAAPRPGIVMVGISILVWGNPYRRREQHSWRCGSCTWTGNNYKSAHAALSDARAHISEHPAAERPELCQVAPHDSEHARFVTLPRPA